MYILLVKSYLFRLKKNKFMGNKTRVFRCCCRDHVCMYEVVIRSGTRWHEMEESSNNEFYLRKMPVVAEK